MVPTPRPAQSSARRGFSDRQWKDFRQAARRARSEGVSITWRPDGSVVFNPLTTPLIDSTKAGNRLRGHEKSGTPRDRSVQQPTETVGGQHAKTTSKKQQRDARRLQEYQETKRAPPTGAQWLLLTQRLLWTARKASCNVVWTAWMRSRTPEARLAVQRKLRDLLWREWTRPQFSPPPTSPVPKGCRAIPTGLQVLGVRSLRDEYIRKRAGAFLQHPSVCSLRSRGTSICAGKALWSWLGYRRELDFDHEWGWKTPHSMVRNAEAADITTPASGRNRKKSRGKKS